MELLSLFAVVLFLHAAVAQNYTQSLNFTSSYTLSWSIVEDEIQIQLQHVGKNYLSWMGFGIHPADSSATGMLQADIYVCVWVNGTLTVYDKYQPLDSGLPPDDTKQNCANNIIPGSVQGFQNNNTNTSVCQFARKLNTKDPCDTPIGNGHQLAIYAFGRAEKFAFHGTNCGQTPNVNFGAPNPGTSTSTGKVSHHINQLTLNDDIVIVVGAVVLLLVVANLGGAYYIWKKKHGGSSYTPIAVTR